MKGRQAAGENPELHLNILKEATSALGESADLEATLVAILRLLKKYAGMKRGALYIGAATPSGAQGPGTARPVLEISEGFGKTAPGQKIVSLVMKTGKPVATSSLEDEGQVVAGKKLTKHSGVAFLCVPIRYKNKVVGALSVDVPSKRSSFERELRLLEIISSIIAQAVQAHRMIERDRERLVLENEKMRAEMKSRYHVYNVIGNDKRMVEVCEQVHQVAQTDATVLLFGEHGTGSELIANAIHYHSLRSGRPMLRMNCAAFPGILAESELFGFEKGAFTGALEPKPGRFELASGGTLFLDEISELSPTAQNKLFHALEEHEIERLGGKKPIRVNVRVIASTHRDLGEMVGDGRFREDLFYALNVFPILLPPLRERRSDIPLLVDHFIEKYAKRDHRPVRRIATSAIDMLMAYHWPGNVRELENCIERAVLLAKGGAIQAHHLPPTLQTAEASATGFRGTLSAAVEAYERDLISDAIKSARGNMTKAARLLGSTPRIIAYKAQKYRIDPESFATE